LNLKYNFDYSQFYTYYNNETGPKLECLRRTPTSTVMVSLDFRMA